MMGYATSLLREKGHIAGIIDSVGEACFSYQRFLDKARKEPCDIIVVNYSTPTIDIDLWMAKKYQPSPSSCFGRPSSMPECRGPLQ